MTTSRVLLFAAALAMAGAGCELDDDVGIQVEGTITDAVTSGPLSGAVVELESWTTDSILASTTSDAQGRYALEFKIENYCGAWALVLRARATGYQPLERLESSADSVYVRCVDSIQTIDFPLQPEP
ncbi:MAG TPA: carboxypeptidase-like regulatory domain-containing protein [Longimicrobiales bacterium]|nr:carboxypeptidase-like regulatory domain-containing protein [Longimicrobiales bacterium]